LKSDFRVTVIVCAFVASSFALSTVLISQYVSSNVIQSVIQAAKAIRHKSLLLLSSHASSIEDDRIPSFSQSPFPSASCINYNPSTVTITVSCTSARLTDINNKLHDASILVKQSPSSGVWLLSANLVIAKGATFHIDPTDTKWLKISSKVTSNNIAPAYLIDVHGSLKIDSVKITSWDPATNYYAITNGSRWGPLGAGVFIFGSPRPSILVENNATGTTDITNSEIAYLGYEEGKHKGGSGLSYYGGGDGSIIRNNDIHHVYFGLYTVGVGHMIIENNIIRNSGHYGLDPHTGTHDMIIRNNTVYDNNGSGIICSLDCYNMLIKNNKVYHNAGDGIDFSRNMYNSLASNNVVYDEPTGIYVSQSHNNQIYANAISNCGTGIYINSRSTSNKIYYNTLMNSRDHAIVIDGGSNANTLYSNKIVSTNKKGLDIIQGATSKNNIYSNNQILDLTMLSNKSPKHLSLKLVAKG
jgi:mannuronan 5-epimerase